MRFTSLKLVHNLKNHSFDGSVLDLQQKVCPFLLQMYKINTSSYPINKLWYITPQHIKPQFLKQIKKIFPNSKSCPFLKSISQIDQEQKVIIDEENPKKSDYDIIYSKRIQQLKEKNDYRVFIPLMRKSGAFPNAKETINLQDIVVWCSNDYLGMGQQKEVIQSMIEVTQQVGAGSGGTRNIGGNSYWHLKLEKEIADLHQKESSLVCSSGFVANQAAIQAIKNVFPDIIFISDKQNHASIIEGMKSCKAEKIIFQHNDLDDLENILKSIDYKRPKMIIYSMSGTISPVKQIIKLAKQYNAQTFIDEVHAVGLYGLTGAGICEQENCMDQIDFITGTLGKGFGVFGGYISANTNNIDCIRSFAPNFIFTTSLPPCIAAGAQASISYLKKNHHLREKLQNKAQLIKKMLIQNDLPVLKNDSHIIPLFIGDSIKAKQASDILLRDFQIYIQPINYPTVKKGQEILRISPTSNHSDEMVLHLVNSLKLVFQQLEIKFQSNQVQNMSGDQLNL